MIKRISLICICIANCVLMTGCNSSIAPVESWRDDIVALVIEHEDLLNMAVLEIKNSEIRSISFTQRDTNFACPSVLGFEGVFYSTSFGTAPRQLENEILLRVMDLVTSVFVDDNTIEFYIGGRGFASATSYFGFYYSMDSEPVFSSGGRRMELQQHDEGWMWRERGGDNIFYTERIIGNFFYNEMHY